MMANRYFTAALGKAASIAGKPGRLLMLISQLAVKLKHINWSSISRKDIQEKLFVLGRLVKAYASGSYRQVPVKNLILIVAAILYFVNPLDLVPDFIPVTGLADDFAILLWLFKTLSSELEKFVAWERSQLPA
jgi:uncharacterized membrane protein YkvA (DUF1232 family)